MPLIQELPVTAPTRASHGWAYIPESGPIAAMAQPQSRKRGRNDTGTTNATATAKQQKAVQQRLEALDKENYKDGVQVPIPSHASREGRAGKKMTPNVRRILTSQRTFQHYLADEEAGVHVYPAQPTAQRTEAKRKQAAAKEAEAVVEQPTPTSKRSARAAEREKDKHRRESEVAAPLPTAATTPVKAEDGMDIDPASTPAPPPPPKPRPLYDPSYDANPLLRTRGLPKMPSDRVMQQLLAEPPLSYTQARATPLDEAQRKPARHFCAVCGYWGRVKCRKCGEWTCGVMDCWKGHEAVCVALGMY